MSENKSKHPVLKTIFIIFLVLAIMAASPYVTYVIMKNHHEKELDELRSQIEVLSAHDDMEVNTEFLKKQLSQIAELATAEMTYACKSDVLEGSVPFVDKAGCVMYYEAKVKAGIADINKIDYKVDNEEIIVTLPAAEILGEPYIIKGSVKYYDDKKALFNWKDGDYYNAAYAQAEEDVKHQATTDNLLDFADKYAEELVKDLLSGVVGNKKVIVKHAKRVETEEKKIKIPVSSSDAKGKNYSDIVTMFESAGFTNIVTEGLKDIGRFSDLYLKENAVKEIAINGNIEFNKNQSIESDALVVIRYHSK